MTGHVGEGDVGEQEAVLAVKTRWSPTEDLELKRIVATLGSFHSFLRLCHDELMRYLRHDKLDCCWRGDELGTIRNVLSTSIHQLRR